MAQIDKFHWHNYGQGEITYWVFTKTDIMTF